MIAVDVDEVLFPFMEHFNLHDNAVHGGALTPQDFPTYRFQHDLNISLEEALARVYSFNGADHEHIKSIDEAQTAIDDLAVRFDLVVITARHPQFEDNTRKWIDRNFTGKFSNVVHIGYAEVMKNPRTKVEVCQEMGAMALIDDSPGHVSECAAKGIDGVLFGNYPWNQDRIFSDAGIPKGVVRCEDWKQVVEYFDGRS